MPSGIGQGEPFILRPWQKRFIYNVYAPTTEKGKRRIRRALLAIARKNGKGLALDTPMPTPTGWTTMGDVREGDLLLDEQGNECRVTLVSEHKRLDCYEILFSNGERIVCDGDHRWLTTARVARPGKGPNVSRAEKTDVRDTRELYATQRTGARGDRNHSIERAKPLAGRAADVLVHPYVLGAWLGDGKSDQASLFCGDKDLSEMTAQLQRTGTDVASRWERTAHKLILRTPDCTKNDPRNLQKRLRAIGVLGAKHIPPVYLRAAYAQRLELLQGLMDTDGSVSKNGRVVEWSSTLKRLTDDFCELLATFGIKYSVKAAPMRCNGRAVDGTAYRVQFMAFRDEIPVFQLKRKLERMRFRTDAVVKPRSESVQIVSITPVPTVTTKCIQVDSPNRLFLCGRTMLPTHNTALAAALVLVHLVGPEAIPNGEVYSAASDRNQAAHIYKVASQMIELDDELKQLCKCMDSVKRIVCYHLGSFYVSLSADARRQHGFNPSFVVYDELAQALNRDLFDVLTTSFGAQEEGLFLAISTQSSDPQSIMSEMADDALKLEAGELTDPYFYGKVYAVPDTANPYDEKEWPKANPGLDDFRSLVDMQALAAKARRSPSAEAAFRNLYLNQRVDGVQSLVNSLDWKACATYIPDSELIGIEADGGLDLSTRQDLTALTLAFPLRDGRVATRQWFWTPENLLEDREKQDGAHYLEWQKQGFLTVLPGKSIDYGTVALHIQRILGQYRVRRVRYDRYRIDDLRTALENVGVTADKCEMVEHGQGYKDMAPAVDALEELVIQHRLCHGGNPLLTYCMRNVKVISDPAGNRKFDKRQRNRRIDGAVTLAMSLTSLTKPVKTEKSYIERTQSVVML